MDLVVIVPVLISLIVFVLSVTCCETPSRASVKDETLSIISHVHPDEKRLALWLDMTKARRARYRIRFRYLKLVV